MTRRVALPLAVLSFVAVALPTLVAGAAFPGYSHVAQFISELGANGAPHGELMRFAGFLPAGLLLTAFAGVAYRTLPPSGKTTVACAGLAVYALGYVAAVFFPCDLGCRPVNPSVAQIIHNAAGLAGYLAAPVMMLLFGLGARSWPGGQWLAPLAFIAAAVTLIGLMSLSPKSPWVGLSQRMIEASVLTWVVCCGFYLTHQRTS